MDDKAAFVSKNQNVVFTPSMDGKLYVMQMVVR